MSLARRLGWTQKRGYVPAMFGLTAFALGVQIALVTEALARGSYPPEGKATMAWASGLALAASALVHVPWGKLADLVPETGSSIPRRSVHLAPHDPTRPPGEETHAHNGHVEASAADLKVRVHSPLSAGPVVAPGEELPVTVEATPEELARELAVAITVRGPDGSRTVDERLRGTQLEHVATFDATGPFAIRVEVDHPRSQAASKTLEGRVARYDEEIGRLFERLKEEARAAGLDVTAGSTPREVCGELRSRAEADPSQLADLAVELEVALYGDDEADRETYETVYGAIAATGLLEEAPTQEAPR